MVGGAVDNAATKTIVDWAAFLCEYSHCLTLPPHGPALWLTGNNVTYRKSLLQRFRDTLRQGQWEDKLHQAFREAGIELICQPDIRVGHKKHYKVHDYASQRFFYSRAYAALHIANAPLSKRLLYGCMAIALPPLVLWRITRNVLRSERHTSWFFLSLPLLAVFVVCWAAGEVAGYWCGDGGALARVC